jgi:S1/P1 Nuclease
MKRAVAILTVSCLMLVGLTHPAFSWGSDGHRTVGMVADLILEQRPASRDRLRQILGENSLSNVSVWADCAKGFRACRRDATPEERAFTDQNPRHHAFHYTDVPIQQLQYRAGTAGTGSDDVVQVVKHAVNVLRGRTPNQGPAVLNQRDALWLLVHLVGDIHQPLHVGAIYFDRECAEVVDPNVVGAGQPDFGIGTIVASTTGGNDLKIGKSKNLHSYWDGGTVTGAMRLVDVRNKSIDEFAWAIMSNPPSGWQTSGDPQTWSTQWATEVLPLANKALKRVEIGEGVPINGGRGLKCTWPVALDRGYTQWANQQALNQLGKAGFRLAALLRAVFEGR